VKKAIELLERVLKIIPAIVADDRLSANLRDQAERFVQQAIAELKTPRWYTPEQWEAKTGEKLLDEAIVWFRRYDHEWISTKLQTAKKLKKGFNKTYTIVANGPYPPPDNWRPE
jgi:hypothetical protein